MATRMNPEEESPSRWLGGFSQGARPRGDMPPLNDVQAADLLPQLSGWCASRSHGLHCSVTGKRWKILTKCSSWLCWVCLVRWLQLSHMPPSQTPSHIKKKKKKETNCTAPKVTKILKYLPNEFMIISSMRRNSVWVAYNKACYGALTCSNCGGCCWLCPWSPITVPCVSVTD